MSSMIEIKPGPELDKAVGDAIGDAYRPSHDWEQTGLFDERMSLYRCRKCGDLALEESEPDPEPGGCITPYSTDLSTAFAAAERVASSEYGEWSLSTYVGSDERGWTCSLRDDTERAFAPTPALAICAAILKLKG